MRLILIRHGQTPSNVLGLLDTDPPGPGLTELGTLQADGVPERVAAEPIDAVFASTATRARLTAAPLAAARGLDVVVRGGVREIAAGDWEMLGDQMAVAGYLRTIGSWLGGRLEDRTPGRSGESGHEVLHRFDLVVAEILELGLTGAVIVAHGAVNRFWASARADNLDDEFGASHPLPNTGIVTLTGDQHGWIVDSWTNADLGGGGAACAERAPDDEDPFDDAIPVPDRP